MKPVFADTGFFLALMNPRDQYHAAACELNSCLAVPSVTTAWVMIEVANAISSIRSRERFGPMLARLCPEPDATVIPPDADLFEKGCQLYTSRADKEWSLTDCTSFLVMKREQLTEALTADRHFEQDGYRALLRR